MTRRCSQCESGCGQEIGGGTPDWQPFDFCVLHELKEQVMSNIISQVHIHVHTPSKSGVTGTSIVLQPVQPWSCTYWTPLVW